MKPTKIALLAAVLVFGACNSSTDETTTTTSASASTLITNVVPPTTIADVPVDEAVWPLTGLSTDGQIATDSPVLVAKIDNTPSSRPQSGLEQADVVFEVLVEGGVSRFLAVFQSQMPDEVGPIRSGREVDPKLIAPFGALFAYSGGQDFVVSRIRSTATDVGLPRLGDTAYYRSADRPAPYDVILRSVDVIDIESSGLTSGLLFGDLADGAGAVAAEVSISLSDLNDVSYTFEDGRYVRAIGGESHLTDLDDPLVTDNVVVVFVDVLSTGRTDSAGSAVPDYDVVGSGTAIVFRDGLAIEGTWVRATTSDMFGFADESGSPIPLAPGVTWIEVVPNGRGVAWQ